MRRAHDAPREDGAFALFEAAAAIGDRDSGMLSAHGDEVYYMGIIDILQQYDLRKRGENALRRVYQPVGGISAVSPVDYARRFVEYMAAHTC